MASLRAAEENRERSCKAGLTHLFDTMVVVEPSSFVDRLRAAGFEDIQVDIAPGMRPDSQCISMTPKRRRGMLL